MQNFDSKQNKTLKIDRRISYYGKKAIQQSKRDFKNQVSLSDLRFSEHVDTLYTKNSFNLIMSYYNLFTALPQFKLNHNPKNKSNELVRFQKHAEERICFSKIAGSPGFYFIKSIATSTVQKWIFDSWFESIKYHFKDETGQKGKTNSWSSNHKIEYIFPEYYEWSLSPRLSIRGPYVSTRKKIMKRLSSFSLLVKDNSLIIIDIDIVSAHSGFALKLAGNHSVLNDLVNNGNI